jgi:hypothetical protein
MFEVFSGFWHLCTVSQNEKSGIKIFYNRNDFYIHTPNEQGQDSTTRLQKKAEDSFHPQPL